MAGSGVSKIVLDVNVGGVDILNQSFGSGAAALSYFKNNAIDLGAVGSAGSLSATVTLSVTTSAAGSTFDTGVVLGAQTAAFASAMASAAPAAQSALGGLSVAANTPLLLATAA